MSWKNFLKMTSTRHPKGQMSDKRNRSVISDVVFTSLLKYWDYNGCPPVQFGTHPELCDNVNMLIIVKTRKDLRDR